jgi:hypothetical protein
MFDYQLTIKIPFQCEDDVDARKEAKTIISDSAFAFKGNLPQYKLQRLNPGRAPEKVEI